jgi:fused signal recognition particle receptor
VLFAIANRLNQPIRYVGVGERPEDLREFSATDFVNALLDE